MKRTHDNDNLPILARHPRLLAPVRDGDCNRQRNTKDNRDEDSPEDTCRELAVIQFRIDALNWITWLMMKKRTVANDSQVKPTGRMVS
jgi:hypothetical protein